jgi:hypothetical protein
VIRQPTPEAVLYAFHTRAMGGAVTDPAALRHLAQRHDEDVEPGWYRTVLRKGGPTVPVLIWMRQQTDPETGELTEPEALCAEIGGAPASLSRIERIWLWMQPITEAAWIVMTADRARNDRMGDALRATHARIDLSEEFITP